MKKVSFIIPVYNNENTVEKCIKSIEAQKLPSFEIIAVNDGSADNTCERLREISKGCSALSIIEKENGGASSARNAGLRAANGDYIIMIDADDYLNDSGCISRYISLMENENLSLLVFGCKDVYVKDGETVREDAENITAAFYPSRREFFLNIGHHLLERILFSASNKIYKADIIRENSLFFDEKLSIEEDYLFNLMYFEYVSSVRFVAETPYSYVHIVGDKKSLSSKYSVDMKKTALENFGRLKALVNSENAYQGENKENIELFFLRRTSAFISNLFSGDCTLSYKEKLRAIREIENDEELKECIGTVAPKSRKDKLLCVLLRPGFSLITHFVYKFRNIIK